MSKIVDLHAHIVPGVDDGSRSVGESLKMLALYERQGITDVFCSSHNGYSRKDGEKYLNSFNELKKRAETEGHTVRLHKGCEILCSQDNIDDIIYGLEIGAISTLGDSLCVLTELYSDAQPDEALFVIKKLIAKGYKPIIAHMERNYNITGFMVNMLIGSGALMQINAFSLVEEKNSSIKERARDLLRKGYVHFIGSDAHGTDHRPPELTAGIKYIRENTDKETAERILFKNAEELLSED